MAIIHSSYSGICQLGQHAAHKNGSECSGSGEFTEHPLYLFLSISAFQWNICPVFSFPSQIYKHEDPDVVIEPPVIHSLTFTSKALCFLSGPEISEVWLGSGGSGPELGSSGEEVWLLIIIQHECLTNRVRSWGVIWVCLGWWHFDISCCRLKSAAENSWWWEEKRFFNCKETNTGYLVIFSQVIVIRVSISPTRLWTLVGVTSETSLLHTLEGELPFDLLSHD